MPAVEGQCQVLRCTSSADSAYLFQLAGRPVESRVCARHQIELEGEVERDWDEAAQRILLDSDAHARLRSWTIAETIGGDVITLYLRGGGEPEEVSVHVGDDEIALLSRLLRTRVRE
jgi:hypothetical protein